MGLMQRAIETYDNNKKRVGIYTEGGEPLAPIGHVLTKADIEITLNKDGDFLAARRRDKSEPKILIPVTEESGGRSSTKAIEHPHPLCDAYKYYSAEGNYFLQQLKKWIDSQYSHPFLKVIYAYLSENKIHTDIINAVGSLNDNDFICWRVNGIPDETPECWKNTNLFTAFENYYCDSISTRDVSVCMVYGNAAPRALQHPAGIIPINARAKLISANDSSGFTYRGRFMDAEQACTVGYTASQKAHNAIRWLAAEQGVRETIGNRVFICWNPQGTRIPKPMRRLRGADAEPIYVPSDYKKDLQKFLYGYRESTNLRDTDCIVTAAFDAATQGRLALAYYNEIFAGTFLTRLYEWDEHCCWYNGKFGIQSPDLMLIVDCAFGTQREKIIKGTQRVYFMETDDKIRRQHLQRLLDCKVRGGVFPADIVQCLANRASSPHSYDEAIWRKILFTACAVIQKYNFDTKKGGNEMAWELDKKDRSFQYGRLLAAMERAEEDYYRKIQKSQESQESQESRQTNAIKFMSEFRQRPFYVFERINRSLHQAYLNRIEEWQAKRYARIVGEIFAILSEFPESDLNKPLNNIYLMGYELQRNAFFAKSEMINDETEE